MSEPTAGVITDVVESAFRAYLAQDRPTAEALYADDFAFTSPQDDGLDKAEYFSTCFPTFGGPPPQKT